MDEDSQFTTPNPLQSSFVPKSEKHRDYLFKSHFVAGHGTPKIRLKQKHLEWSQNQNFEGLQCFESETVIIVIEKK